MLRIAISFLIFTFSLISVASARVSANREVATSLRCEIGTSANSDLAKIFNVVNGKDLFLNNFRIWKKQFPNGICGSSSGVEPSVIGLVKFGIQTASLRPEVKISRACVAKALTSTPGVPGYTCQTATPKRIDLGSQCYTPEMIDYLTWAYNMAIDCLSTPTAKLDPKILFMKITRESIFHYSVASTSGVGIGQVTDPAITEMSDLTKFRKPLGQGKGIIDAVIKSDKHSCKQFQKTLQSSPGPTNTKNYCPIVQQSEGLAYSVLYSVGYFRFLMEKHALPLMRKYNITDPKIHNLAALAMYNNPNNGLAKSEVALKAGKKSFRAFEAEMKKIAYVKAVYDKSSTPLRSPAGLANTLKGMGCSY